MNDYPAWWDTTVTVYNKYTDPLTNAIRWYRHVIDGCFWKNVQDITLSDTAQILSNNVICRIRKDDKYLPRGKWKDMPNDLMGAYFTLGKADIIVQGEVDDVIDETVKGHRATDLIAKYKDTQDCIAVKTFSDNSGKARNMPHYYVTGE